MMKVELDEHRSGGGRGNEDGGGDQNGGGVDKKKGTKEVEEVEESVNERVERKVNV